MKQVAARGSEESSAWPDALLSNTSLHQQATLVKKVISCFPLIISVVRLYIHFEYFSYFFSYFQPTTGWSGGVISQVLYNSSITTTQSTWMHYGGSLQKKHQVTRLCTVFKKVHVYQSQKGKAFTSKSKGTLLQK